MLASSAASALSLPCISSSSPNQSLICRIDLSKLANKLAVVELCLFLIVGVPIGVVLVMEVGLERRGLFCSCNGGGNDVVIELVDVIGSRRGILSGLPLPPSGAGYDMVMASGTTLFLLNLTSTSLVCERGGGGGGNDDVIMEDESESSLLLIVGGVAIPDPTLIGLLRIVVECMARLCTIGLA